MIFRVLRQYDTPTDGKISLVQRRQPYGIVQAYEVWRGQPAAQKWAFQTLDAARAFMAQRWKINTKL